MEEQSRRMGINLPLVGCKRAGRRFFLFVFFCRRSGRRRQLDAVLFRIDSLTDAFRMANRKLRPTTDKRERATEKKRPARLSTCPVSQPLLSSSLFPPAV